MAKDDGKGVELTVWADRVRKSALLEPGQWTDEKIEAVFRAVAPVNASLPQLAMFLSTCQRYELDPFVGEIWLGEVDGKVITLTGRDTYLTVARRDPRYGGILHGVIYEGDGFRARRQKDGSVLIEHEKVFPRGKVLGAYCVAKIDGQPDILVDRDVNEYAHLIGGRKKNWRYVATMMGTRCIAEALRFGFGLHGLYMPEEFHSDELAQAKGGEKLSGLKERTQQAAGRNGRPEPVVVQAEELEELDSDVPVATVVERAVEGAVDALDQEEDEHDPVDGESPRESEHPDFDPDSDEPPY
jgi:hypothetical protein